jgi:hypothetical protein
MMRCAPRVRCGDAMTGKGGREDEPGQSGPQRPFRSAGTKPASRGFEHSSASFYIWLGFMSSSDQAATYRLNSAHCIDRSRHVNNPDKKAQLLAAAQAWRVLAEQVEKNCEITSAYETPETRQQVAQQQQQPQPTKE